jgi:hypothetical protein
MITSAVITLVMLAIGRRWISRLLHSRLPVVESIRSAAAASIPLGPLLTAVIPAGPVAGVPPGAGVSGAGVLGAGALGVGVLGVGVPGVGVLGAGEPAVGDPVTAVGDGPPLGGSAAPAGAAPASVMTCTEMVSPASTAPARNQIDGRTALRGTGGTGRPTAFQPAPERTTPSRHSLIPVSHSTRKGLPNPIPAAANDSGLS